MEEKNETTWIIDFAENGWIDHVCSRCGYVLNADVHVSPSWNYCPHCGRKIIGASWKENQ